MLVIKLADRLHNMRTLGALPAAKQEQKARETLEIFAPLAHRLGMNAIKWELEDLAFATLYPKMFDEIGRLVDQRAPQREEYLAQRDREVDTDLGGTRASRPIVTGRPKHYYSVYQKMIVRGRDFADIYDLVGVRVLVDACATATRCWASVHAQWNPVPGRFKDYIAMPKFNMYQSLHTTVIGPEGKPVELQIRTHEMHRAAEYGVAAHWKYKEEAVGGKVGPDDMAWLKQLLDWQSETEDPDEFLDSLRFDLGEPGDVRLHPEGRRHRAAHRLARRSTSRTRSTPRSGTVAWARRSTASSCRSRVHPRQRRRRRGVHVQGRGRRPEARLAHVRASSPRARNKIKAWFSKERREECDRPGQGRDRPRAAQAGPVRCSGS